MQLILGRFYNITGFRVGAKTKSEKINPDPNLEDINEKWDEIKLIKTLEKYQEVSSGVFTGDSRECGSSSNLGTSLPD